MPTFVNDHVAVPVSAVVMTNAQLEDLKKFLTDIHGSEKVAPPAVLSDSQFGELKALLQPGFECSKLMLADYKARGVVDAQPQPGDANALRANQAAAREAELAAERKKAAAARDPNEWRTGQEILDGVPFDANRAQIEANRTAV